MTRGATDAHCARGKSDGGSRRSGPLPASVLAMGDEAHTPPDRRRQELAATEVLVRATLGSVPESWRHPEAASTARVLVPL